LRDVVDGLAYAHRQGVIHRDIKPDNVMLADRHAMLVDFGVAKAVGAAAYASSQTLTGLGTSLGTPAYMAPEQAAGDPNADARVDIYAVGILAYEILTGSPPFSGTPQQVLAAHITTPSRPIREMQPGVPERLAAVVMRCLEKEPAARFQTAEALLEEFDEFRTPGEGVGSDRATPGAPRRRLSLIAAGVIALLLGGAGMKMLRAGAREREARAAIPELQRLAVAYEFDSAFGRARELLPVLGGDPVFDPLWNLISAPSLVSSEPPGATVFRAPFNDTTAWEHVGVTPLDSVFLPRFSLTRLRIELEGYRPLNRLVPGFGGRVTVTLDPLSAPDADMVRVNGGQIVPAQVGLDHLPPVRLSDFRIDRHEVTNAAYKAFVSAGGYQNRTYWTERFERMGSVLSFDEALGTFTDRTGRPGPATWEGGDYPAGQGDYPVGGVSWYEAEAYARFAGKNLPTVYHWSRAAGAAAASWVIPGSRLEAAGPAPGSRAAGMSPYGTFDMAGNVREWTHNSDNEGKRYILGGGWSDLPYAFNDAYAQDPFDRSPINGIRLARYAVGDSGIVRAEAPVRRAFRDFNSETPVSDAEFQVIRRTYDYDRAPLNTVVEWADSTPSDWVVERVTYDAAYGNERGLAYLFTPKRYSGPHQAVMLFPGDGGFGARGSTPATYVNYVDWLIRSGRSVITPVFRSTFERSDSLRTSMPNTSIDYRDHVVMWAQDARRAVDYLESRADIDTARIAYFGVSWGGRLGGLVPAIEPRFKATILFVAGFRMQSVRPEADPFNFVPRIRMPILMLNAKYDDYFPVESSQKPFFRLLGTPLEHKRHVVYDGGHMMPRTQLIPEALSWLDKYLGPVR
jgi:dienelactone hydrolase